MKWISVDDKLPGASIRVIGATPLGDGNWIVRVGTFDPPEDHGGVPIIITCMSNWHYISHWMPLPAPPEVDDVAIAG